MTDTAALQMIADQLQLIFWVLLAATGTLFGLAAVVATYAGAHLGAKRSVDD